MQSFSHRVRHACKRQWTVANGPCRHFGVFLMVFFPALEVTAAQALELVDLELVLSVDASGSVDADEYRLQLKGIAAALNDPQVIRAIRSGAQKRIAVDLLTWGESRRPKDHTGWFVISNAADAAAFAAKVVVFPRRQVGGTGLGDGIAKSVSAIFENTYTAPRMIVDVSGDGRETPPRDYTVMLPQARAMSAHYNVTINGLAILNEDPELATYYREEMIVGDGAFVEVAADYEDFARAMKRKLLREISPEPVVGMR
jgi:hypothetical protein